MASDPVVPDALIRGFAELCAKSCFSFLEGASQPEELVQRAHELGLHALAICDRNGVYGVVRAHAHGKKLGYKTLVGADFALAGTSSSVILLVQDHRGYSNLCFLLTQAHAGKPKGTAQLAFGDLSGRTQGLVAILPMPHDAWCCEQVLELFPRDRLFLAVHRHLDTFQRAREVETQALATRLDLNCIATSRPLMHYRKRKPLADVLSCIRNKTTLDTAGGHLLPNAEACLHAPERMYRLFQDHPDWLARTVEIADSCIFSLSQLRYRFPCEYSVMAGESSDDALRRLVQEKLGWRYPNGVLSSVLLQIEKELALIKKLSVAPYFLSVYEIVEIARERKILCQGRGSAANSAVCFVLGITAVDPARANLLFERFISVERAEPPDIDVDFEHERREEVIQEIYRRYGRDRAAMVSEVISYRGKSALRDVSKAFGLSLEQADRLSSMLMHSYGALEISPERLREVGLDPDDPRLQKILAIAQEIIGFPRHLSIHVGGFILSSASLSEIAPIEPARMEGRTVIPWDKDDLDTLGFFKIDILALGMLTCIRKALAIVMPDLHPLQALAAIPAEDRKVYEALSRADAIGVFQVESRAQMSMLPRLAPRCFYDLVIEVAIIRPGPIQGGMVHPYLRRRKGQEPIAYPHPKLEPILKRTLGVPLFQEQVMQISIEGAGYSGGEADQLRRDMAAWRKHGRLLSHRDRLFEGFAKVGISMAFAEQLFKQIQGFAEYGFPESHAASFALLVYASAWLKVHHPAAFAASLLNSQPMGFYSPSSIVRDAKAHGVEVLAPCVVQSSWDCTLTEQSPPAIRLGLRLIRGLGPSVGQTLVSCRHKQPFQSLDDLIQRVCLRKNHVEALAEAGALEQLVPGRRHALWRARAPRSGPLFETVPAKNSKLKLPPLPSFEQLVLDYDRVGLSIHDHPMRYLRSRLNQMAVVLARDLPRVSSGRSIIVAGVVLNRQQPYTATGVVFITLEDETGMINLFVPGKVFEKYRLVALHSQVLLARGKLENQEGVMHLMVRTLDRLALASRTDTTPCVQAVNIRSRDFC